MNLVFTVWKGKYLSSLMSQSTKPSGKCFPVIYYLFSTLTCISEPCFTFTEISTSNVCTGENSHKIFCRRLELINDQGLVNGCVYLETRSIIGLRNTNCVVFYNTILFVFRRFLPGSRKRRRALCNDWNFAWRTTWS